MGGHVSREVLPLLRLTPLEHKTLADDPDDGLWDLYVYPVLDRLGDVSRPLSALLKYDTMSYPDFLHTTGASPDAIRLLTLGYDTRRMSALYVLREMKLAEGAQTKVRGGNERLPRALAQSLSGHIILQAEVMGLHQTGQRVSVHYREGSRHETLQADFVVCTLPFSVLRSLPVTPAWSPAKKAAVTGMTYASVTRNYLQYATRFWEKEQNSGFALTDDPLEVWAPTWDQPGPQGLLMTYAINERAQREAAQAVPERSRNAQASLRRLFGTPSKLVASASVVWDEEPFSLGAYCAYGPGQMASILPAVATSEGRVFFAGEHTSPWRPA
jgi:monoamine oxidase